MIHILRVICEKNRLLHENGIHFMKEGSKTIDFQGKNLKNLKNALEYRLKNSKNARYYIRNLR